MRTVSNACDPEEIFSESLRYRLHSALVSLATKSAKHDQTYCSRQGIDGVMVIMKQGTQALADQLKQKWANDPQCQNLVVFLYSDADRKLYMSGEAKSGLSQSDFDAALNAHIQQLQHPSDSNEAAIAIAGVLKDIGDKKWADYGGSHPSQPLAHFGKSTPLSSSLKMGMRLLFHIDPNDRPNFDEVLLKNLVSQIAGRKVAVISVVGGFREGKSFFDNILLKALQAGKAAFRPDETIGGTAGIEFKNGPERHTIGIQVWDQIFVRKDTSGNEVAVLLLDTQGMFDTQSQLKHSTIIFMISLMLSSHFIFNKNGYLNAHDLVDMNVFVEMSQTGKQKVGQHLYFLMRNWGGDGDGFAPQYLEQIRNASSRTDDLKDKISGVFQAFDRVECYTVPAPGGAVTRANGSIKASDCDQDFLNHLCQFANHVVANVEPRRVLGAQLAGGAFEAYVKNVLNHVTANSALCVNNALQATIDYSLRLAKDKAMAQFNAQLPTAIALMGGDGTADTTLNARLATICAEAQNLAALKKEFEHKCNEIRAQNSEKRRQHEQREATRKQLEALEIQRKQEKDRADAERKRAEQALLEKRQTEERLERERREATERQMQQFHDMQLRERELRQEQLQMFMMQQRLCQPVYANWGGGYEPEEPVRRGPGRPPGSKNKPKVDPPKRGPGRPPGSKNKPK
ncbi:unnamed protein product, partial [Mesorhabditis spiculigera]